MASSGEATVEIEHCIGCDAHQTYTRHTESKYEDYASKVNQSISENVSPELQVFVNPKPNLGRHNGVTLVRDPYSNIHYNALDAAGRITYRLRYPRLGAFEVFLRIPSINRRIQIFSKLTCGKWPTPDAIAQRIQRALQQPPSLLEDGPLAPLRVVGPVSHQASHTPPSTADPSSRIFLPGGGNHQLNSEPQGAAVVPKTNEQESIDHAAADQPVHASTKRQKKPEDKRKGNEDKGTEDASGKAGGDVTIDSEVANSSRSGEKPKKRHKDKQEGSNAEEPNSASITAEHSHDSEHPSSTLSSDKAKKHHKPKHNKDKSEGSQEANENSDTQAETGAVGTGDSAETGEKKKKKAKAKEKEDNDKGDEGAGTKSDTKKKKKKASDGEVDAERPSDELPKEEPKKKKKKDEDKSANRDHGSNEAVSEKQVESKEEKVKEKDTAEKLEAPGGESGNASEKKKKKKKDGAKDSASPHEESDGEPPAADSKKKKKKSDEKKEASETPDGHDDSSGAPDAKKKKKKSDEKKGETEKHDGCEDGSGVPDAKKKKNKDKGEEHGAAGENKEGAMEDHKGDKPKKKSKKEKKDSANDGSNETGEKHKSKGNPLANCSSHPACTVTRNYELTFPVGAKQTQKLSYQNPKEEGLSITIASSDETVMTPKKHEMTLAPGESVKIPVAFQEVSEACEKTVYLYMLHKESEKILECVEISLTFK